MHTWAARNITWRYVSSYENVQNVNVLKNYFAIYTFMFFLKSKTHKQKKERKKLSWGLSKHNTSFFPNNRIQNIYNTISNYCTEPRRSNRHCLCLFLLGETNMSLCWDVTLESLEQLAWCFRAKLCFLRSGTGLGLCRYPSELWRRRQSSAHLMTPTGPKKIKVLSDIYDPKMYPHF